MAKLIKHIALFFIFIGVTSCATYHHKINKTKSALIATDYDKAKNAIDKNKFLHKRRNLLLYHLEIGKVFHLQQQYDSSNFHLNIADDMMEQMSTLVDITKTTLVNEAIKNYKAAPHETILIHYYKALNYLYLNNKEDALVEARRLNLKQQKINIAKHGKDNKYSQDPFGLMLMGMIYESSNDFNNAFIAYRNAYETYQNSSIFKGKMPESLPFDVVRTAKQTGIQHPITNFTGNPFQTKGKGGELILFWENGIAPAKAEKNMIFTINKANGQGAYIFTDMNNTFQIPFNYNFNSSDPNSIQPSDIGLLRVASAFYVSSKNQNHFARLTVNGENYPIYLGEDIESLAFKLEREDQLKNLGIKLMRVMVKKITEIKVAEANEFAGIAVSIANFAMEKSDTRNWQSLPNEIYFTRIPLDPGKNTIELTLENNQKTTLNIEGQGQMVFKNIVNY
ncbi:MAG: COG3014 family protein [Putridiphycobacter sp.]